MKKRIFLVLLSLLLLIPQVSAQEGEVLHWVEFDVDYPALKAALDLDIQSQGEEKLLSWIDILALAATRTGGKGITVRHVEKAAQELKGSKSPKEFLGNQYQYFAYYQILVAIVYKHHKGNIF